MNLVLDKSLQLFIEFWALFAEMAPYLVLGFFLAGVLHVYFPKDKVHRYLGGKNLKASINAALAGVPLPLCSCGVIPTGVSFYKNGASKGASISFLISTPQTGVDSILATYSLMGLPFAIIRPIVALITGIFGGQVTNWADPAPVQKAPEQTFTQNKQGNKFLRMFRYAFVDFLQDIAKWLLIGLAIAAVITVLIPDTVFTNYLSNPYLNMLLVLIASVPMYVCATGSIPVAMALLMKGISPGAAFVFLMAGPATNAGTITVIGQSMGKRALFSYMATIIAGAIISGIIINEFLPASWFAPEEIMGHAKHLIPKWIELPSSIFLAIMMLYVLIKPLFSKSSTPIKNNKMNFKVKVDGMTCNHCKASVENNAAKIKGIKDARVDLDAASLSLEGEGFSEDDIKKTVESLGYKYGGKIN